MDEIKNPLPLIEAGDEIPQEMEDEVTGGKGEDADE